MMKSSMNEIDGPDADDGPVVSEGGRSPSTLSTGRAAPSAPGTPTPGPLAPGQRWSVGRKREVVLRLLRGESAELLSRELGLPLFKLEQWRQKAEAALDGALKEREADPADSRLAAAMQRIGELSMEVELLRARLGAVPHRRQLWAWRGESNCDSWRGCSPHPPPRSRRNGLTWSRRSRPRSTWKRRPGPARRSSDAGRSAALRRCCGSRWPTVRVGCRCARPRPGPGSAAWRTCPTRR